MQERSLQEQIGVWRERHAAAPASRAFAPLADLLRRDGRVPEALALLEDGLVRHPDFPAAMVILGQTLLDAGRADHARRVLRKVLEQDPQNLVALRLLAEEARSRRAWGEAVRLFEMLVALDPDEDRWPAALAEAVALRTVPAADPPVDPSFATLTLVEIYLAQGYRNKALTALHQMLAREPGRQDLRDRIAEIGAPGPEGTTPPATPPAFPGGTERRRQLAERRAQEKRHFADWIERIRGNGEAAP